MSDPVLVAREDAIATVTLNRPERLNALDLAMWQALGGVMEDLARDQSLRCVILRGAGKAFAAGADLAEFATARATPDEAAPSAPTLYRATVWSACATTDG